MRSAASSSSAASPAAAARTAATRRKPALEGSGFWAQLLLLCEKNWLITKRNWKQTVGQLLTPIAVVVLLVLFQLLSDSVLNKQGARV